MTLPNPAARPARMPVLFVGHGSPMNAIKDSSFSRAWADTARRLPRPKAILCVSAHWETEGACVTAMPKPKTIHDFGGFPEELYRKQYPAPGAPELAGTVRELLGAKEVHLDREWGLDHGTWSVLCRMYPAADIPTIQLSLDIRRSPQQHYDLARRLAPLRAQEVLILGSGNLVHNLPLIDWTDKPYPWAARFDKLAAELIVAGRHAELIDYPKLGDDARLSIPTNEHYLPLLYALALQTPGETVRFFAEGLTLASISMRSVQIGG